MLAESSRWIHATEVAQKGKEKHKFENVACAVRTVFVFVTSIACATLVMEGLCPMFLRQVCGYACNHTDDKLRFLEARFTTLANVPCVF